jgi:hypothetical protein
MYHKLLYDDFRLTGERVVFDKIRNRWSKGTIGDIAQRRYFTTFLKKAIPPDLEGQWSRGRVTLRSRKDQVACLRQLSFLQVNGPVKNQSNRCRDLLFGRCID